MKKLYKILVVDNEPDVLELLAYNLQKEGYFVKTASSGVEAINEFKSFAPDIILLDIMMQEMDGIETCRSIIEISKTKPYIIFLTARYEEFIEVAAFDAGANDYVVKPVKIRALVKRINLVFQDRKISSHTTHRSNHLIKIKDIVINKDSHTILRDTQKIILPKKEFEILCFLCENTNKVFSRDDILKKVWMYGVVVTGRTVDVHIKKIRERVGHGFIKTIVGKGYIVES